VSEELTCIEHFIAQGSSPNSPLNKVSSVTDWMSPSNQLAFNYSIPQ